MHYFATLNRNYVCDGILQIDDNTYNINVNNGYVYENDHCIAIDSYDESLIYKKKYINGEWVDALPSECDLPVDTQMVHMPDDMWLNEALGTLGNLNTADKTSLVAAINELTARIAALEANN